MSILYYELSIGRKTPKYVRYNKNPYLKKDFGPLGLSYQSTRIWDWDPETDSVRCIKNRFDGFSENTSVDKKEFLVVQLTAQEYKVGER